MTRKWATWLLTVALIATAASASAQAPDAASKAAPAKKPPAAAEGAAAAKTDAASTASQATCTPTKRTPCRYTVRLLKVPPSRVWCRFEGESGPTVVFDPADPEHGTTASVVSKSDQLRCYSEPAPRSVQVGDVNTTIDVAWEFDSKKLLQAAAPLQATARNIQFDPEKKQIFVKDEVAQNVMDVTVSNLPTVSEAIALLDAQTAAAREGRLFGEEFSTALKDTLELLAEIAAERAKSKGARLIEQRLQKLLCRELRYEIINDRLAAVHEDSDRGKPLLPNLCAVIRNVPLGEMVESAPKIARALQLDVFALGFDLAVTRLQGSFQQNPAQWKLIGLALARLNQLGVQLVLSRQFTAKDAQTLVLELAHDFAQPAANDATACDLALAFAAAGVCQAKSDGCQANDIVEILRNPGAHIGLGCTPSTTWREASSVVAGMLSVLSPPSEMPPRAQYRTAVVLTLDLVAHVIAGLNEGTHLERNRKELATTVLTHTRALVLALFDDETRVAATHGLELVRVSVTTCRDRSGDCEGATRLLAAVEKITPLLVAFTANAESLKQEAADAEQRKALREARKKTLEAVIDASTQRARRGREHIVSIGANVGVRYGYLHRSGDASDDDSGNLSLPMGIAYQYLPPSDAFGLGFHSQISFVDLAQFLATSEQETDATKDSDSIEWNDFALVGAQVGVAFGTSENAFTLSADVRYFPGGRMSDAWFFGGVATYYVPFFDLN